MVPAGWIVRELTAGRVRGLPGAGAALRCAAAVAQRRAYFRTHNGELPLPQQYLARLQAAHIRPLYVHNGDDTVTDTAAVTAAPVDAAAAAAAAAPVEAEADGGDPPPLLVSMRGQLARTLQQSDCRTPIEWSRLPPSLVPASHMNAARAQRKQDQLQNMINALRAILAHIHPQRFTHDGGQAHESAEEQGRTRPTIVDFCCGSGHLGFPVAFLFPWCDVILLEWNATAIARAHCRLSELRASTGLAWSNVRIVHAGLQEFDESFDVGIGVHACGWLSDVIQIKCFQHRAAFLLAPCCIGKLKLGEGREITLPPGASATRALSVAAAADVAAAPAASAVPAASPCCGSAAHVSSSADGLSVLHYPRSALFTSLLLRDEYLLLASKADYSDERWNFASAASSAGSRYKSFIEWDRLLSSEEHGYVSVLAKMNPPTCTPKNDLVFGLHQSRMQMDSASPCERADAADT